jgi:hypothetical protein
LDGNLCFSPGWLPIIGTIWVVIQGVVIYLFRGWMQSMQAQILEAQTQRDRALTGWESSRAREAISAPPRSSAYVMMQKLARGLGLLPTRGSTDGVLSPDQYARRERALSNRLRRLELLAIEADVIKRTDAAEWELDPTQDGDADLDSEPDQIPEQLS